MALGSLSLGGRVRVVSTPAPRQASGKTKLIVNPVRSGENPQGTELAQLKWLVEQQSQQLQSTNLAINELRQQVLEQHQQLKHYRANPPGLPQPVTRSPFEAQAIGIGDRRMLGLFDARFHSTSAGASPRDFRVLPERIFLVRHAESEGNIDNIAYSYIPDSQVPLTARGAQQARSAGAKIRNTLERGGHRDYRLFFYTSPYKRSLQTYEQISSAFGQDHIVGVQEEVQLREQDFGNFQDPAGKQREMAERLRFGRFFYRFPDGESGADVYDRLTIFEDHLIRDINAGRFANRTNLVLVTHGLALRIFLMRWFHWTVDQFLNVYNPPNAEPLVLERMPNETEARPNGAVAWVHTKALYRLTDDSMRILKGCTHEMCVTDHLPRTMRNPLRSEDDGGGPTIRPVPRVQEVRSEDDALTTRGATTDEEGQGAAHATHTTPAHAHYHGSNAASSNGVSTNVTAAGIGSAQA